MIENYLNTTRAITLKVYSDGVAVSADAEPTVTAVDHKTGETVTTSNVTTVSDTNTNNNPYNYYEVTLDASETTFNRTVKVTFSYAYNGSNYTRVEWVEVVTPIFYPNDLWTEYPEYSASGQQTMTYEEVARVESKVRHVIEQFIGYKFEYFGDKTFTVLGNQSDTLQLPYRINRLEKVSARDDEVVWFDRYVATDQEVIDGDAQVGDIKTEEVIWDADQPWIIRRKTDFDLNFYSDYVSFDYRDNHYPKVVFEDNVRYFITADTGYEVVPSAVRIAGLLIANEWLCEDFEYHAKNIESVKSADYKFDYFTDHRKTTGHVEADRLLANVREWRVWSI